MLSEQEQRKSNFSTGTQMYVAAHEVMVLETLSHRSLDLKH